MSSQTTDRSAYIARLWLDAGKRRREAGRLEGIILETLAEADRIEATARKLESELEPMPNPKTTEFLPCPFCGGDAIITEGDRVNQNAYCHGCDAQGPLVQVEYVQLSLVTDADTEAAAERARERWNQRVKNV